jgi:hypothetical protein
MATKMLIERVDNLEIQFKNVTERLALVGEFMELILDKLPQYDVLLENRKLVLSKAKAMRLAGKTKKETGSSRSGRG